MSETLLIRPELARRELPIAVDVMTAERGIGVAVEGALAGAERYGQEVLLVGNPDIIRQHVPEGIDPNGLNIRPAYDVFEMDEDPKSVRSRRDSSVMQAAEAVRQGEASAMISAGNTGATGAAALLRLGLVSRRVRPAIATLIPIYGQNPKILMDSGMHINTDPEWLADWAIMGSLLAVALLGINSPRVGILSNGEELKKGTEFVHEARRKVNRARRDLDNGRRWVLSATNIERPVKNNVNIMLTDGFNGNLLLKFLEDYIKMVIEAVEKEHPNMLRPEFAGQFNADTYGGAVLLGVGGVCVISHGDSSAIAIANAVGAAGQMVEAGIVESQKNIFAKN